MEKKEPKILVQKSASHPIGFRTNVLHVEQFLNSQRHLDSFSKGDKGKPYNNFLINVCPFCIRPKKTKNAC